MSLELKNNTEKLNWRERLKCELKPVDYLAKISEIELSMIGDNDRVYLQDAGIYNHEAEEDSFSLRLRLNAGRISSEQLLRIASLVKEHDLEIILTVRAQMQLHGLDGDNVLEVWEALNANGISTWQTMGDNVRNIVTDVYDGRGVYAEIEVFPYIEEMQAYILNNPKFVGLLPRRISVAISGNRANVSSFFANDLFFALAEKEDEKGVFQKGFNVYLGGKNTELAQTADVFLRPEQVVSYFIAVIEAFHLHGSRARRGKTRLFYWLEEQGLETVKNLIDQEHDLSYSSAGTLLLESYDRSTSTRLKDKRYAYIFNTDYARVSAETFEKLAAFASKEQAEVRLGIDQHIYILGLKEYTSPFEENSTVPSIAACAGGAHCTFSFWHLKDDTEHLPLALIKKHHILLGFSGCLKGCAKHQHADIGVVGMKTSAYGRPIEAARIFLGGEHTFGTRLARYLNLLVPKTHLKGYLEVIIQEFEHSGYKAFEDFSTEVLNTYSADFLSLWFLAKLDTAKEVYLQKNSEDLEEKCTKREREKLQTHFPSVFPSSDFEAQSKITQLAKALWTLSDT